MSFSNYAGSPFANGFQAKRPQQSTQQNAMTAQMGAPTAAFQTPAIGTPVQPVASTFGARLDTGGTRDAAASTPFAQGVTGRLDAPLPDVMSGKGRNLCYSA